MGAAWAKEDLPDARKVHGVEDKVAELTAQHVAALLADAQDLDRLAVLLELVDALARGACDGRVEAAAQAPLGGGDDDKPGLFGAGADQHSRRPFMIGQVGGQRGDHSLHAFGVGPCRLGPFLGAPQPRRRHHAHGPGDFLGRAHAVDARAQVL